MEELKRRANINCEKKKERKIYNIICIALFAMFCIFTALVQIVDVKPVGLENTELGFSSINLAFSKLIGTNDTCYKISKYTGIIAFVFLGYFGITGLIQLIQRKDLLKVDKEILGLGVYFLLILGLYFLFSKVVIINYRPVLDDGALEASYPSSHTILAICLAFSAIFAIDKYIKNETIVKIIKISAYVLMGIILVTRILSGVHWITDIFGGIILASTLVMSLYNYLKNYT